MSTMKRRAVLSLALVFAVSLVAAPLAAQDWAGRGRAEGIVKDEEGNPVAGVKVTLHLPERPDTGPDSLETNDAGRWSILGLSGGNWVVVLEKDGFMTSEGSFRVNEFGRTKPLEVTLQRSSFSAIGTGQQLFDEGRFAEARAEFESVLPHMDETQQAQLRALIGNTYYEEGNYTAARAAYQEALPALSAGEQTSIRLRLGDTYLREEQYDAARAEYEKTLEGLGPEGQLQVLFAIARTYDEEGDRDQAISTMERALEIAPDNVQALQLIADLLGRAGREDEAQTYLDRVPAEAELPADMLLNQGIRYYNQGEMDKALANFDRVIQQNAQAADAYYYRGLVYLGKTENDQARADFEKLLELDPESQYAGDAREFLQYLESQ